jgi:hypothetical protein
MRRIPLLLVVLLAALAMPPAATAATIVFFNEQRFVNANTISEVTQEVGFWSSSVTSPTAGGGRSTATQTTDISASFIGGIGLAEEQFPSERAASFLQTHFTIDAPFTANLDIELFEAGLGFTRVFLQDRARSFERVWDVFGEPGLTNFSGETILAPGTYFFWMEAGSVTPFNAVSSFNGGLTLAPIPEVVPEPASMTLFGLGLLAAGARRLRRPKS